MTRGATLLSPDVDDLDAPVPGAIIGSLGAISRLGRTDAAPFDAAGIVRAGLQDRRNADGAFARQLEVVAIAQRLDRLIVGVPFHHDSSRHLLDRTRDRLDDRS